MDVCQTQVPGCTYPYAQTTVVKQLKTMVLVTGQLTSHYFTWVTGVVGTLYSFGGDDDDSNNEWVGLTLSMQMT